jgi:hypothetical protein
MLTTLFSRGMTTETGFANRDLPLVHPDLAPLADQTNAHGGTP